MLYRKAKAARKHRFWSLYGEVQRADVLKAAWRRVADDGGAAGVDGVSIEAIRVQGTAAPMAASSWLGARWERDPGARQPPTAGAGLFFGFRITGTAGAQGKACFGEGAETSTRGACATRIPTATRNPWFLQTNQSRNAENGVGVQIWTDFLHIFGSVHP